MNDDKFLCYSCNNWLINWHSLQNKNEASSSNTSKNQRFNQPIPEEHQQETMAVLVDQYSDVLRLRSNLRKYFYYPGKTTSNTPKSAIQHSRTKCNIYRGKVARKRYCTYRTRFINKKCFRFCHRRKQTVRPYVNKSSNVYCIPTMPTSLSHSQRRMLDHHRSSQTIVVNPCVVSRLKQFGTTVICEGTSATADNDLSRSITNNRKKIDQSVIQSSSNEIIISFNTLLQEVFPVDLSVQKDVVMDDFSEIFERIPKSLSITLA